MPTPIGRAWPSSRPLSGPTIRIGRPEPYSPLYPLFILSYFQFMFLCLPRALRKRERETHREEFLAGRFDHGASTFLSSAGFTVIWGFFWFFYPGSHGVAHDSTIPERTAGGWTSKQTKRVSRCVSDLLSGISTQTWQTFLFNLSQKSNRRKKMKRGVGERVMGRQRRRERESRLIGYLSHPTSIARQGQSRGVPLSSIHTRQSN